MERIKRKGSKENGRKTSSERGSPVEKGGENKKRWKDRVARHSFRKGRVSMVRGREGRRLKEKTEGDGKKKRGRKEERKREV